MNKSKKTEILVISTYPPRGSIHGNPFSGVASYSKNTLLAINQNLKAGEKVTFTVLADILDQPERFQEQSIKVIRCWHRNQLKTLWSIGREARKHPQAKKVFLALELGMFGRRKVNLALLPLLFIGLRLAGKRIYFVNHSVIYRVEGIGQQLGIKSPLKAKLLSQLLKIYYRILISLSEKVVAFEEYLRQELIAIGVPKEKITTIAHGVHEIKKVPNQGQARKKLGLNENDFIVLCFGYLIWYKGSDLLIKAFKNQVRNQAKSKNQSKKLKLIMAGGESRIHQNDPSYRSYLNDLYQQAQEAGSRVEVTGFLPEEKIADYFAAADLVVLPYRTLISASGPLSFALAYRKPFLISQALGGYAQEKNLKKGLKKADLKLNEITFPLTESGVIKKIIKWQKNTELLEKGKKLSGCLYQKRRWPEIGKQYKDWLCG